MAISALKNMQDAPIIALREAVEEKVGRKIQTPKDFNFLRDCIFDECHIMVSASTLKRIWGYNRDGGTPRTSSVNPLAQLIGYEDYPSFLRDRGYDEAVETAEDEVTVTAGSRSRRWLTTLGALVAGAVIAVAAMALLGDQEPAAAEGGSKGTGTSGQRVLHKGDDCFRTIEDYLPLFGVEYGDTAYFRPVPGLHMVYVWGPEYGHPVWHNEGDSSLLMPTITEYWQPLKGTAEYQTEEYVRLANEKLYYERLTSDELRITFMKGIVDGFYVFLGIYRMDRDNSTKEKFVWERVSDVCDLGALQKLEALRKRK